jgi:hypothetical protein
MTRIAAQVPSRTRLAVYALLLTGVLLLAGFLRFDRGRGVSARLLVAAVLLVVGGRFVWWIEDVIASWESSMTDSLYAEFRRWVETDGRLREISCRARGRSSYVRTRLLGMTVPLLLALYTVLILVGPSLSSIVGATKLPLFLFWFVVAGALAALLVWLQLRLWWSRAERQWNRDDAESQPS